MKTSAPITVYYNSACPVCEAGIASQRGRMPACQVAWVDVHAAPDAAAQAGTTLEAVRERLHVRGADGSLHVGSDALAEMLRHTPRWRLAGMLLSWTGFLTRPLYNGLARLLYRWNRRRGHW